MRLAASGIALAWAALVAGVAPVAAKVAQPVDLLDRCNVVWDHLRSVKSKFLSVGEDSGKVWDH